MVFADGEIESERLVRIRKLFLPKVSMKREQEQLPPSFECAFSFPQMVIFGTPPKHASFFRRRTSCCGHRVVMRVHAHSLSNGCRSRFLFDSAREGELFKRADAAKFHVRPDIRSRFYDPTNPDCPSLPHAASHTLWVRTSLSCERLMQNIGCNGLE